MATPKSNNELSIARVESVICQGIEACLIQIEVDIAEGLPQLSIVGLPDASVKESRERVRSAIKNSGMPFPPEKITVNLAPAEIKKEGPTFDLPIALGILAAEGLINPRILNEYIFVGELALDGSLRSIRGGIVIAEYCAKKGKKLILPIWNACEAAVVPGALIYPVKSLRHLLDFLMEGVQIVPFSVNKTAVKTETSQGLDFKEIRGQPLAKRAVEIAVAGGHNLLLIGSPGSGKTMLARRIPSILPELHFTDALEITKIHSVSGAHQHLDQLITKPPFRSPHHNVSAVAIAGGGTYPKPGEVSLAHGGVLFLDELPEFRRDVLEALRAPMEDGTITVSRARMQMTYPCRFMLAAAMNPCPCGFLQDPKRACRCSLSKIQKYRNKISGPILDRIDLQIEVAPLKYETLIDDGYEETSEIIRGRITAARLVQQNRFKGRALALNSTMNAEEIGLFVALPAKAKKLLEDAMKQLHLSARAYYKVLKLARTIADLGKHEIVREHHIAEAIQYRTLDRQW